MKFKMNNLTIDLFAYQKQFNQPKNRFEQLNANINQTKFRGIF